MAVERIIGIDFGTSTSVIRVKRYENGKSIDEKLETKEVVFDGMGASVPTLIQKKDDDTGVAYYGHEAQQKRRKHTTYHSFKVDLESGDPDKRAEARKLTEEFFGYLAKVYMAQSEGGHLGSADDKERTIVSYPVKWSEETRQFMLATAKKAGFPNVSGMDEAQAAIHAVTIMSEDHLRKNNLLENGKPTNILLIDMGAGTTDLVLCRHTPGAVPKTEIINTWPKCGEILFGGREIDYLLMNFFRRVMEPETLEAALKSIGVDQFKSWKETMVSPALTKNADVTNFFALDNYADIVGIDMDEYCLDRAAFEECLGNYLKQFPVLVNGCIDNSGIKGSALDLVIVTGGHSQWYFVKEMLAGKMPQFGGLDLAKIKENPSRIIPITRPQETVALGLVYSPIQVVIKEQPVPVQPVVNDDVEKTDPKLPGENINTENTVDKISFSVDGHGRFQETVGGSRQFADLWIRVEPLAEKNTIVAFEKPFVYYGLNKYYAAIEQEIRSALQEETFAINQHGLMITVYDGSYHLIDSTEFAFRKAAVRAFKDAISKVNKSMIMSTTETDNPYAANTENTVDKISFSVDGHGRFQETVGGSRQFADLWIRVEPLAKKNTIVAFEKPFVYYGLNKYYAAIEQEIRSALQEETFAINQHGLMITVYDGSYHLIDSTEFAFRKAAVRAFKDAISKVNKSMIMSTTETDNLYAANLARVEERKRREETGKFTASRKFVFKLPDFYIMKLKGHSPSLKQVKISGTLIEGEMAVGDTAYLYKPGGKKFVKIVQIERYGILMDTPVKTADVNYAKYYVTLSGIYADDIVDAKYIKNE